MRDLFLVGSGGMIGAIARYGVGRGLAGVSFPAGTLIVNLVGCFLMGWLAGRSAGVGAPKDLQLFWGLGVLGAFTTFSTFSVESLNLLRTSGPGALLLNVGLNGVGCLFFAALGMRVGGV